MKGHVPTPKNISERIVRKVFRVDPPSSGDRILYPGSGTAPFATSVEQICEEEGWDLPDGLGVELDPRHLSEAREHDLNHVEFEQRDFLADDMHSSGEFDYIIGNPPYVAIEGLSDEEKLRYREKFRTAEGRFDLYLLFFEQAVNLLAKGGRLAFITPEKYEYVDAAIPLRKMLTNGDVHVKEIDHVGESALDGHVTIPCVTVLTRSKSTDRGTSITLRDGSSHVTNLPQDGSSWAESVRGKDLSSMETGYTLGDVTERISPGMATGADAIFVEDHKEVPPQLVPDWVYPTVSGSQLTTNDGPRTESVFICPYNEEGELVPEAELGAFREWAKLHRSRLEDRSCVKKSNKEWYAWHENPPMKDLLQPKIVFKDIEKTPKFWAEEDGDVIPRHSVYYMIPKEGVSFSSLLDYLNSSDARVWMEANCQKAANGFLRLQTRVIENLPVPQSIAMSVDIAE
ncbi:Eco57I restriction-modification methylase domain-containing protein [Halarchaeum sp. CBA1220]|uniref:Eco57I restriction-modification methylase domain-containing protein n=1 Tax=Halarchaeum sp. CBA1220 TaxID=1853682 RepID=UPI000F3A9C1B|nr:TaqI-like C-terminal specificity domain-containing protein [Halarchaeum sp. CBA1220]QLC34086.1 Eco57I restriction-modification methylase domain-containing protein [Halarchaeum sp. CBA1220]